MIDAIEIDNFQSHQGTVLSLVPGVNVLTGTSDSGKSAVVRALVWLIQNRPQGVGYRSTFAARDEATRVGLSLADGGWVIRERDGGKLNQYRLEGLELEALRADVPQEVSSLLDLREYNVQGQHDAYFLLQNTPGEVARMLNDVVGLDVIDALLREVNSIVTDSRREADRTAAEAKALEASVAEYDFLKLVDRHVEKLDTLTGERDARRAEVNTLSVLVRDLELADQALRQSEAWLAVDGELAAIEVGVDDLRKSKRDYAELVRIEGELSDAQYRLSRHEALADLTERSREVHRQFEECRVLDGIVTELEGLVKESVEREDALKALTEEERKLLARVTTCPMCRRDGLTRDTRENVLRYFQGKGN